MRHGQALSNVRAICSNWPETFYNPLTKLGREIVEESTWKILGKNIDLIFASPLLRTQQTAAIVGKFLKVEPKIDRRLREIGFGKYNGGSLEKMWKHFKKENDRIRRGADGGETYSDILKRMLDFLKSIEKKYKGKNILIVSHEGPLFLLQGKVMGLSIKKTIKKFPLEKRIHKAEVRELN
ncbi:MAG: histidine phosphatase family protein [Candidatus Staskawiczbacteria bacterium]